MSVALDRAYEGLETVCLVQAMAMILLDRAQLKSRLVRLTGTPKGMPMLSVGPAIERVFWGLYVPWTVLGFFAGSVQNSAAHPHGPSVWAQVLIVSGMVLLALAGVIALIRLWRRWRKEAVPALSRGELLDGVRKTAETVGLSIWSAMRVYVLPDVSLSSLQARFGTTVLVPRQLLDSMSRREIDALAAWQLCLQSRQYYSRPFWILLAFNAAVACLLEWLVPGEAARWAAMLPLIAVDVAWLSAYLPGALRRVDLRAAELTADPEAYLSSMAGLCRLTGVPMNEPLVTEIARRGGIAEDRLPALLAEHTAPIEDRYPTTGSYLTTGL